MDTGRRHLAVLHASTYTILPPRGFSPTLKGLFSLTTGTPGDSFGLSPINSLIPYLFAEHYVSDTFVGPGDAAVNYMRSYPNAVHCEGKETGQPHCG